MDSLTGTAFSDPVFGLAVTVAAAAMLTVFALRSSANSRVVDDPLAGLFQPDRFEAEIEGMKRRSAPLAPHGAILHGQIDHLS